MGIEDIFSESMSAEPEVTTPANDQTPAEPVETPELQAETPQPEPEMPQAEAPQQEEQSRHVPLATFLDQRDELKRWKQEADKLRQDLESRSRQPESAPDPLDDPQGFAEHQDRKFEERLTQQRFQISDTIARQQHGAETVDAAGAWAAERARQDPGFAVAYMQQSHPIDWIVQQHKRDQLMSNIGDDPDEWVRRRYAEINPNPAPIAAPAAPQQPVAPTATPPRSLATVPGSGGVDAVPTGPMAALGSVFTR